MFSYDQQPTNILQQLNDYVNQTNYLPNNITR